MRTVRLCLALALLPSGAMLAQDFSWTTNNGAITITDYTGSAGEVTVPDTITGLPVTEIQSYAFFGSSSFTNIVLGNNVISIGNSAFASCGNLRTVTVGTNVANIGDYAFSWCVNLRAFDVPDSVTNIGDRALFRCTNLTEITVAPSNPSYAGVDGVLFNKSKTTLIQFPGSKGGSYSVPDGVTNIAIYSFYYCSDLSAVTISDSVVDIDIRAFDSCNGLTQVLFGSGLRSIGSFAFVFCGSLSNVAIGNSVTNVGDLAFQSCYSLTNVSIGSGVANIGTKAFSACASLREINVDSLNPFYSSIGGVLFNKAQTTLVQFPTGQSGTYTVPGGVTAVGDAALDSPSLTGVFFLGNAPSHGSGVFAKGSAVIVYYLPGATGWGATFAGRPAVMWSAQVATTSGTFGVGTNGFGFDVAGTTNIPIVIEACTNLGDPYWITLQTNILSSGSYYFSDAGWTNHPARFYHVRWP